MIERRMIRPAMGLKIRDHVTMQFLPEEGKEVAWSSYWERRLIDGDVVLVEAKLETAAAVAVDAKTSKKMGDKK